MNETILFSQVVRVGTGLAFVLFPMAFIFAFAVHPGLFRPRLLGPEQIIRRAHGNKLLHLGHGLVTLSTPLLVLIALHFMTVLDQGSFAWAGLAGAALAIVGAVLLAADKGALCLTMSAFDSLSETEFAQMMPGLRAMFSKAGWLKLLWGMLLLPAGFAILAICLLQTQTFPRWQGLSFVVGVLLVGTPDGLEIINLAASVLMAVALVPYGITLIVG